MNWLEELIKNLIKFNLLNEVIDLLRELFVIFEMNLFFLMSWYDYVCRYLI